LALVTVEDGFDDLHMFFSRLLLYLDGPLGYVPRHVREQTKFFVEPFEYLVIAVLDQEIVELSSERDTLRRIVVDVDQLEFLLQLLKLLEHLRISISAGQARRCALDGFPCGVYLHEVFEREFPDGVTLLTVQL
jgi:hypothetical protein